MLLLRACYTLVFRLFRFDVISCRKVHYRRFGFVVRVLMDNAADDPFPSEAEGLCLALKHGQTYCDQPRTAT